MFLACMLQGTTELQNGTGNAHATAHSAGPPGPAVLLCAVLWQFDQRTDPTFPCIISSSPITRENNTCKSTILILAKCKKT